MKNSSLFFLVDTASIEITGQMSKTNAMQMSAYSIIRSYDYNKHIKPAFVKFMSIVVIHGHVLSRLFDI